METSKLLEEQWQLGGRDTGTCILYADAYLGSCLGVLRTDLPQCRTNDNRRIGWRIFEGIREQVAQNLTGVACIGPGGEMLRDLYLERIVFEVVQLTLLLIGEGDFLLRLLRLLRLLECSVSLVQRTTQHADEEAFRCQGDRPNQ